MRLSPPPSPSFSSRLLTTTLVHSDLNLYPPDIFSLLRALAVDAGLGTEQLDGIVALGGYAYVPTSPNPSGAARQRTKRALLGAYDEPSGMFGFGAGNVSSEDGLVFVQESKRGLVRRDNIYTGCVSLSPPRSTLTLSLQRADVDLAQLRPAELRPARVRRPRGHGRPRLGGQDRGVHDVAHLLAAQRARLHRLDAHGASAALLLLTRGT